MLGGLSWFTLRLWRLYSTQLDTYDKIHAYLTSLAGACGDVLNKEIYSNDQVVRNLMSMVDIVRRFLAELDEEDMPFIAIPVADEAEVLEGYAQVEDDNEEIIDDRLKTQ